MHVLDTNILIELEKHNDLIINFLKDTARKKETTFYITSPTYSEFLYGYLEETKRKKERAVEFLELYPLLQTSKASSTILAELKYFLEKKGTAIPIFDLFIVSIVIANQGTFITMDKHFKNIPELDIILF